MITTLATALIFATFQGQTPDSAERMLRLATADQPLVNTVVIKAPVKDVWQAWTTDKGISSWMVAKGEINLKVGGEIRTSYNKDSNLNDGHTIVNSIIAFDPERMLAIKVAKFPTGFPFPKAIDKMWTVVYFESVSPDETKVVCRSLGFSREKESQDMKDFFRKGNQVTLEACAKYFESKTRR